MIWLLLNIVCTASIPSVPCSYPSENRLDVVKSLGGDTAETADSRWPKGYPMPYNIIFSDKMGSFSKVAVPQGLAGHLPAAGDCFCISFFLHLLNCLSENPWVCSFSPFFSLPYWWGLEQDSGGIFQLCSNHYIPSMALSRQRDVCG